MMRWFRKTPIHAKSGPSNPPMPWSTLTLDGWRTSDVRVKFATKLFSSRLGQDMLAVLQNTMPPPDVSDASRAAIEAGRVRGYMQAMATLMQMQVPGVTIAELPEPTYDTTAEEMLLAENE